MPLCTRFQSLLLTHTCEFAWHLTEQVDPPGDLARAETGHLRFIGRARSKRLLKRHLAGWASPERVPDGGRPYLATHLNDLATVQHAATSQEQINPPSVAASPAAGRASRGFNQARRGTR